MRAVQCIVRHNNVTKSVEASLCEDAGLANPDVHVHSAVNGRLEKSSSLAKQPANVQKCGLDTCPHWVAGSWTPCNQSRCFTWNTGKKIKNTSRHLLTVTFNSFYFPFFFLFLNSIFKALQKRKLDCVLDNGTLLDSILCNDRDKPSQKRECFNENCRGAWKVSDWSHVSHELCPVNFFLFSFFKKRWAKNNSD